jgi:hypothetical protein
MWNPALFISLSPNGMGHCDERGRGDLCATAQAEGYAISLSKVMGKSRTRRPVAL